MPSGVHAEVEIGDPRRCQVSAQATSGARVTEVSRAAMPKAESAVREEFTVTEKGSGQGDGGASAERPGSDLQAEDASIESLFSYDGREIYRLDRDGPQGCVCERIEASGCVVRDVSAVEERLVVCFLTPDIDQLQTVLEELTTTYADVTVRRLLRSGDGDQPRDLVLLDRRELTERQEEVLRAAHDSGYFEHPRSTSATEVADSLGIAVPTFTEHLATAQRKLLNGLLASES